MIPADLRSCWTVIIGGNEAADRIRGAAAQGCWRYSIPAEASGSNHQLQWDVPVSDMMSAPRLLVAAHFV
jgi:hypothetical protein